MRPVSRLLVVAASLSLVAVAASAEEIRVIGSVRRTARFDTATGERSNFSEFTGLAVNEEIKALATGGPLAILYGLTDERLYLIDAISGAAMPAGPRFESPLLLYRGCAFVIHPATGVGRILLGTSPPGANPNDGTSSIRFDRISLEMSDRDPQTGDAHRLAYASGDPNEGLGPVVIVATYHPVVSDTPTLYGIDTARATLVRVGPLGNSGFTAADDVVATIAPLSGLPAGTKIVSMEAQRDGTVLLVATDGSNPIDAGFWSIDLATGAATALSRIDLPLVTDVALAPAVSLGGSKTLVTEKATVALNFRRRNADRLKVVGRIARPLGGWAGKNFQADFGGIVGEFALDARGRGRSGRQSVRMSGRARDGTSKYTLELRGDRFGRKLRLGYDAESDVVTPVFDLFVRERSDTFGALEAHRGTVALVFSRKTGRAVSQQQ